jgi:hypothetical protein
MQIRLQRGLGLSHARLPFVELFCVCGARAVIVPVFVMCAGFCFGPVFSVFFGARFDERAVRAARTRVIANRTASRNCDPHPAGIAVRECAVHHHSR